MSGLYLQGCLQACERIGTSMKQFWLGFLAATAIWLGAMSFIEIPEYTIIHRTQAVCT
jgi:hypothetical protein